MHLLCQFLHALLEGFWQDPPPQLRHQTHRDVVHVLKTGPLDDLTLNLKLWKDSRGGVITLSQPR